MTNHTFRPKRNKIVGQLKSKALTYKEYSMTQNIADLRQEYKASTLLMEDVDESPMTQFKKWFSEALASKAEEPNAMSLATINHKGHPANRIVLLKEIAEVGIKFYTNYDSRKGRELSDHPFGAATFFWPSLERQVRMEGLIEKVSREDSDNYFESRPDKSKIGAWASPQSEAIESREVIERREQRFEREFANGKIPRPEHWGGYILKPDMVEFWQGRRSRLHDRIAYSLSDGIWGRQRLAP